MASPSVDTTSHKVIKVLAANTDPKQFAMSNDDKRLYVANEDIRTLLVVESWMRAKWSSASRSDWSPKA